MKTINDIVTKGFKGGIITLLMALVACSPLNLDDPLGITNDSEDETTETSSPPSAEDSAGDWSNPDTGEATEGLPLGDLRGFSVSLDETKVQASLTLDDEIPTELRNGLLFYSLDFVIIDPAYAMMTSGFLVNVSEQISFGAYGPEGTALETSHSVSSDLPNTDENEDEGEGVTALVDGKVVIFTIFIDQLLYSLENLCNLQFRAIVQTHTEEEGYVIDTSNLIQVSDGICQSYTRSRCWYDAACTKMMGSSLITRGECRELGGKGWGPDSDDCRVP